MGKTRKYFSLLRIHETKQKKVKCGMWDEKVKIYFHTVAGETRVACVRLGVESSIFEFLWLSFCCCDDPPTDVDAVDEDVDELEAPCCP